MSLINCDNMLDKVDNGIIVLDEDLKVLYWNKWLEIKTQIRAKDVLDNKLTDFFDYINKEQLVRKIKVSLKLNSHSYYVASLHKYFIKIKLSNIINPQFKYMIQNVTIMPYDLKKKQVYIYIYDVTNIAIKNYELNEYKNKLQQKVKEEIIKNNQLVSKLIETERLSAMGEMIGNIAHQWRQPLSVISALATGVLLKQELNTLDDEHLVNSCNTIIKNTQYLSQTIDDFRGFIKGDREKVVFDIKKTIEKVLTIINTRLYAHNIEIITNIKNIEINSYENELIQCFVSIINNSIDALKEKDLKEKLIFIDIKEGHEHIIIKIKDNGNGIADDVLPHIFEPYFTTKEQFNGTGLGLSMTYRLITEGMNGSIKAYNENFIYNNHSYRGAVFEIVIKTEN